jgi:hypothetical protein
MSSKSHLPKYRVMQSIGFRVWIIKKINEETIFSYLLSVGADFGCVCSIFIVPIFAQLHLMDTQCHIIHIFYYKSCCQLLFFRVHIFWKANLEDVNKKIFLSFQRYEHKSNASELYRHIKQSSMEKVRGLKLC